MIFGPDMCIKREMWKFLNLVFLIKIKSLLLQADFYGLKIAFRA